MGLEKVGAGSSSSWLSLNTSFFAAATSSHPDGAAPIGFFYGLRFTYPDAGIRGAPPDMDVIAEPPIPPADG